MISSYPYPYCTQCPPPHFPPSEFATSGPNIQPQMHQPLPSQESQTPLIEDDRNTDPWHYVFTPSHITVSKYPQMPIPSISQISTASDQPQPPSYPHFTETSQPPKMVPVATPFARPPIQAYRPESYPYPFARPPIQANRSESYYPSPFTSRPSIPSSESSHSAFSICKPPRESAIEPNILPHLYEIGLPQEDIPPSASVLPRIERSPFGTIPPFHASPERTPRISTTRRLIKPTQGLYTPTPEPYSTNSPNPDSERLTRQEPRIPKPSFPTTAPFVRFDVLAWMFHGKKPNDMSTFVTDDHGESLVPDSSIKISAFDGVSITLQILESYDICLHSAFNSKETTSFYKRSIWYENTETTHLQISSRRYPFFGLVEHKITLPPTLQNNRYLQSLYANAEHHSQFKKELGIFFNAVVLQMGQVYLNIREKKEESRSSQGYPTALWDILI